MHSSRKPIALGAVIAIAVSGIALAETASSDHSMGPSHMQEMRRQHQGTMPTMGDHAEMQGISTIPMLPGQDAFGAIQEIVHILDADPKTDWSKVDLEALRQHLIDMNEVTLHAEPRRSRSRRFGDCGHRQRAHTVGDPANDPRLGSDGKRQ